MVAPLALAGIGAAGSLLGGLMGGKGAKKAAKYQYKAAKLGIDEQRRQFDQTRGDFEPWRGAGVAGLGQLGDLVGINGGDVQGSAIEALRNSPFYQSLYRTGEEAVLQNASATGGIRGGNTQRGLADFGADTLMQTIERQLASLSGLAGMGMGATESVANFGANKANQVTQLLGQQGQARAGSALTQAGIWSGVGNNIAGLLGSVIGGGARGGGGGYGGGGFGGGGFGPAMSYGGIPGITGRGW